MTLRDPKPVFKVTEFLNWYWAVDHDSLSKTVDFDFIRLRRTGSASPRIFVLSPIPRWRVFTIANIHPRRRRSIHRRGCASPQSALSFNLFVFRHFVIGSISNIWINLNKMQFLNNVSTSPIRVLQCCIFQAMRSASVKKLFYYYGVYTGCCVGFNTVFSKLKCDLVV